MRNVIALTPALANVVASTPLYYGGVYTYGWNTFAIQSNSTGIGLNNTANTAYITLPNYGSGTIYNWVITSQSGSLYTSFSGNKSILTLYGGATLFITCNISASCGTSVFSFSCYNYSSSYSIFISPNPASQTLTVSAKLLDSNSLNAPLSVGEQILTTNDIANTPIKLIDQNGNSIANGKLTNSTISFDIEKIQNGIYYLLIGDGKDRLAKRILIQH